MQALVSAVSTAPQNAAQVTVSEAAAGAAIETTTGQRVFWSDAVLGDAVLRGERVERTATVEVYCYV